MEELSIPGSGHCDDDIGCAYLSGEDGARRNCGAPRRLGSPYCPDHHTLCHVPCGTREEIKHLREVEALANAVGGRRARDGGGPSRRFLRRLEHAVRGFS
jgi:hypothetical protein